MSDPIKFFIVRGSVRGLISRHRIEARAYQAAVKDRKACKSLGGGAYSDARGFTVHASGNVTGPYQMPDLDR